MKKYFALAIAAIAFVSCSSETTEELAVEEGLTRAKVENGVCTVRGELCDIVLHPEKYQPNEISNHVHCTDPNCQYYYEALSHGEMVHHLRHNGGHGEAK